VIWFFKRRPGSNPNNALFKQILDRSSFKKGSCSSTFLLYSFRKTITDNYVYIESIFPICLCIIKNVRKQKLAEGDTVLIHTQSTEKVTANTIFLDTFNKPPFT